MSASQGAWECRHGVDGRDWCEQCHSVTADPLSAETRRALGQKLRDRLSVGGLDSCWEWQGFRDKKGYGRMAVPRSLGRKSASVHRIAWQLWRGPIPAGRHIHHRCENPSCANPRHLEVILPSDHSKSNENSITTKNRKKTHCVNGHELTPENTYLRHNGWRICLVCKEERRRTPFQPYGRSRYRGVSAFRGKWKATISPAGKRTHLGIFVTEEEAARAYDAAALDHFGEGAYQNFPEQS